MADPEERIALFLDYENLAIGARDRLHRPFDLGPVSEAMAERGRVVVRRAYADWSMFNEDRRMLTRHHVEMVEMTQRMGKARKNSADIKLAVDAIELAFERGYITTFVLGTGDSDFTPLVHKLRELDRRVIGVGVQGSTSNILPPACDEFLFYDRLIDRRTAPEPQPEGDDDMAVATPTDVVELVVSTLTGLLAAGDDAVRSSTLKRTILRKEPTFNEADHGFRAFGELLRGLAADGVVELEGRGDAMVSLPAPGAKDTDAMSLLQRVVGEGQPASLSGLKAQMRKHDPEFNEKRLGYSGFLAFAKAAAARDLVTIDWDEDQGDYVLSVA
ncbi:MAG: NYN domain-containing protein [Acidimicrobiia bacterium]|nr:NYN domain-containing protein [Acidimicrobiia bacterium]